MLVAAESKTAWLVLQAVAHLLLLLWVDNFHKLIGGLILLVVGSHRAVGGRLVAPAGVVVGGGIDVVGYELVINRIEMIIRVLVIILIVVLAVVDGSGDRGGGGGGAASLRIPCPLVGIDLGVIGKFGRDWQLGVEAFLSSFELSVCSQFFDHDNMLPPVQTFSALVSSL